MHVPKLNAFVSTFLYAVPHLVLSINMQASVEQISDKCWQQPKFNKTKKQISHQIFTNIISWQWFANRPLAYLRYVDDTFAVFNNGDDCNTFLSQLNSLHPSLRFTHEKEFNHSLPFLGVLVERLGLEFSTSVYRKSTFTGQYLRWNSFSPPKRKSNLIGTLIHRAFMIC